MTPAARDLRGAPRDSLSLGVRVGARLAAIGFGVALAGCAATADRQPPPVEEKPPVVVKVEVTPEARTDLGPGPGPSAAALDAFAGRLEKHEAGGREACVRGLVRDHPALALALHAREPALRPLIASAWRAAFGTDAGVASERARTYDPAAHARAEGFAVAARAVLSARDLDAALALEACRTTSPPGGRIAVEDERAWLHGLAALALDEGHPLVALRAALAARRLAGTPAERLRDDLLAARAQLAAGKPEAALELALAAGERTEDAGLRARSLGLAGEALLALDRGGEAAEAFARAIELVEAAPGPELARHGINLAVARLWTGDLGAAEAALDRVEKLNVPVLDPKLIAPLGVARALALAAAGDRSAAALGLDRALAQAARAGDAGGVESCLALRARLPSSP